MIKNLLLKSLIAASATSVAILSTPEVSMAQVNTSFLTEVAESCQKDVFSSEYYQQMGNKADLTLINRYTDTLLSSCIKSRYFYLQVISKLPWLVSTEEMLPGYPSAVAVSGVAHQRIFSKLNILDCLASQNSESQECTKANSFFAALYSGSINISTHSLLNLEYVQLFAYTCPSCVVVYNAYTCPSCVVVYNTNPSGRKMVGSFIKWFIKLEPSQKKELMSILGDEQNQRNNRNNMRQEAHKAWQEYQTIRQRLAEEEKERRRRELFE